ncbi:MAG: hypothetical protein VX644_12555 [Planctomycetota bacterium]|nr:hypothetical protein [Planctomycetota bacterium]
MSLLVPQHAVGLGPPPITGIPRLEKMTWTGKPANNRTVHPQRLLRANDHWKPVSQLALFAREV